MNSQRVGHPADQGQEANLRRLDWRFLLPTPSSGSAGENFRHLLLLGGTKALANRIIAAKIAEQVSCELGDGPRVDAVILLHDSTVTLEEAAASLEQGGVLYQEVARGGLSSLNTTPKRIRQRLEQVGLTLSGLYWAAPNFDQCRRYIPLDVPGALQWYFSSLFVAGTPFYKFLRALVQRAVGANPERFGWFVPSLSITAIAGSPTLLPTLRPPSLLDHPHIAKTLQQDNLRPMIVTSGQDDASRLILLPFAPQGQRPEAVIKVATDPKFNAETEVEQTVLQEVRTRMDVKTRQSVPEPLGVFRAGEMAVSVERCAPGKSLWVSSGEWGASPQRKIADMEIGARWLTTFHQQTESSRLPWNHQAIERWVETPIAAYAQARTVSEAEARLFAYTGTHANKLIGAELPLVWQHHDFAPWNLFRDGEQLTVIDWEFNRDWESTRAGPALCDLLYFVTYWNNVAHHLYTMQAELDGIRALFLDARPRSQSIQAARQTIAAYMTALQIDWRFLPLLLVYTWTERVVYSYGRAHKLVGRPGPSRAADKFANYVGLLADHAEELFAVEGGGFWQEQMGSVENIVSEAPVTELLA